MMANKWERMAEDAGFIRSGALTTSSTAATTTGTFAGMRVVGSPLMPDGYTAIVSGESAVILGPKGAYAISWGQNVNRT
jgi:hypothetical protein